MAVFAGCKNDDGDPPPVYDPLGDLKNNGGGTTGGAHSGEVSVLLFDDVTDNPVSGGWVVLEDSAAVYQLQTDATGRADFSGIAAGAYTVTAVETGYVNFTLVGIHARYVAIGMEKRQRITVSGTVNNGSASGTTYAVTFATQEQSLFDPDQPMYGTVTKLPTGGDTTYSLDLDADRTETVIFTETDNGTGRILNRKVRVLGPYTTNQSNVDVDFDGTTGLHEMSGTVSNLPSGVTALTVTCTHQGTTAVSYSAASSGPNAWDYSIQVPPDVPALQAVVRVWVLNPTTVPPNEAQAYTLSSGSADNATPAVQDLALAMVTVSGSFQNYASIINGVFFVLRYGGFETLQITASGLGYTLRIPTGQAADATVFEFTGSLPLSLVIERYIHSAFGPYTADASGVNFDFAGAAPDALSVTTNIPAGVTAHTAQAGLVSSYGGFDVAFPWYFAASGTVGASTITYNVTYGTRTGCGYAFMVSDEDTTNNEESLYIRGGLTDPATEVGTSVTVTLLDVLVPSAPGNGSSQPSPQVTFTWGAANLDSTCLARVEIYDASGNPVWYVTTTDTTTSFTLPVLPVAVTTLSLQSGSGYGWSLSALSMTNLDLNELRVDALPLEDLDYTELGSTLRISSGPTRTFSVQ
jgi:hypothetical protein